MEGAARIARKVAESKMNQVSAPVTQSLNADLALKGYTKDPEWMFKTGLGGTIGAGAILLAAADLTHLMFCPIAIALSALTVGFVLRTIRLRLRNPEARLADWSKWVDMFMAGITWLAVHFCWATVAGGFFTIAVLLAVVSVQKGAPAALIYELLLLCGFSLIFWMSLFTSYLMVNFAQEEKLSAGFAVRKVFRAIRKNPKIITTAWALASAIQLFAVIGTALSVIGLFLLPSVVFAAQLVATTILAQAWRATWPEELPP